MKEDSSKDTLLLLQDNLDGKVQADYQQKLWSTDNALCWYYPPEYTDNLAPHDNGVDAKIKQWFGIGIDDCLWEEINVE